MSEHIEVNRGDSFRSRVVNAIGALSVLVSTSLGCAHAERSKISADADIEEGGKAPTERETRIKRIQEEVKRLQRFIDESTYIESKMILAKAKYDLDLCTYELEYMQTTSIKLDKQARWREQCETSTPTN